MLRPKWVSCPVRVAGIVVPLAVALNMSVSHQAMAACEIAGPVGTYVTCSGVSELPVDDVIEVIDIQDTGAATQVGARLTPGTNLTSDIDITSVVTTTDNYRVYGIAGTSADDSEYTVQNDGNITVKSNGLGFLAGIAFPGDSEETTVTNNGTITVERGDFTIGTNSASSLTGDAGGGSITFGHSDSTNGIAAGIWVQEEENMVLSVTNEGTITAKGMLTSGIHTRGAYLFVENEEEGVITTQGAGSAAIVAYNGTRRVGSDYFLGNTTIINEGEISGYESYTDENNNVPGTAIVVVEPLGIRYQGSLIAGYDPLGITSSAGRRDSTIVNSGSIIGNIYLGAGNHVLVNTDEGEIEGDIDVDQRRTLTYSVSSASKFFRAGEGPSEEEGDEEEEEDEGGTSRVFGSLDDLLEAYPAHYFMLDNAAEIEGNVTVHTNVTTGDSQVVLRTHVTGSGAGSDVEHPSENSGFIDKTLTIGFDGNTVNGRDITESSVADTTIIQPVIDSVVHSGEWFLVARQLFGDDAPDVDENSFLVDWVAEKNQAGALVIGATVHDASTIDGLSKPGIATLNGLLATDGSDPDVDALATAVLNMSDEDDLRLAGEELKPDVSFGTQQAAITLAMLTGQSIDNRLAGVGATGGMPAFAPPSGLGMSQQARLANDSRMSLGLGTSDGRMNIGANDGRMDAGLYDDPDARGRGPSAALWGQAFGAALDQNARDNVDGYQANIYGALAGADNWVNAYTRVGAAIGYGRTTIDGTAQTIQNDTDVDSYLGILYGAHRGSGWYLSGRAGYAWHDYDTRRVVTTFNDTAVGSHSGDQFMAAAEIGMPMQHFGGVITPVASLTWSHLQQDGYTESSGQGVGLTIDSQENTSLMSGVGAKALIPIAKATLLEGRAIWYHEFADTEQQVTAAFAGGPDFSAAGPSVGRDTAAVGLGLFAYTRPNISFQMNYDALLRQDFIGHTGSARVNVEF